MFEREIVDELYYVNFSIVSHVSISKVPDNLYNFHARLQNANPSVYFILKASFDTVKTPAQVSDNNSLCTS